MARAKRGGEVGKNGEFYEGGKFLPSTDRAKRRGGRRTGVVRAEVEPGVFSDAPEGKGAIWQSIKALVANMHERRSNPDAPLRPIQNPTAIECHGGQEILDRIDAYNRGERWFNVSV
jgi:hypothetical protein